jgi:microcystin-dependent protein
MITVSYSHAVTVPQMINYSGTLNDVNGSPVANGNYSMEFRIYNQASGGAALWTEKWDTTTSQVPVVNGTFNVMLGAIDKVNNPIPASFFAQYPTTYLGIKVGNDSEMLPRQMITSVGYALSAWNGVPKGGIIMWSGAIIDMPAGWALCDGANGTPNLRDRFIVGAGSGYAVNTTGGEITHTLTASELPVHTHTQNAHNHGASSGQDSNDHNHYDDHQHSGNTGGQSATHTHTVNGTGGTDNSNNDSYVRTDNQGGYHPPTSAASNDHTHGFTSNYKSEQGFGGRTGGRESAVHTHGITVDNATATNQNTGGGSAHENRPPYYALAFIMKL